MADLRPKWPITALEIDENGMPIVKVRLSAKQPGIADREFRFIFDTGATLSVIDASVPPNFFWEEPEKTKGVMSTVGDSVGQSITTRTVCLKRLEIAGMVREDLVAYRMDLKGTLMGRLQDAPVDGILGMNFLRDTRFVIDPVAREIRWWQDIPGHRIQLSLDGGERPTLAVKLGGTEVPCLLDTGVNGGFMMPGEVGESDPFEPFLYGGVSGGVKIGKRVKLPRLESGGKVWVNIPLDVVVPGEGSPNVGRDVLWAAPLGLDFIDRWATFTLDSQGNLPYRKTPTRPPLIWERGPEGNRLQVWRVSPASRWAKAGAKEGDEVIAIGGVEGKALNLRSAITQFGRAEAHSWRVRREGTELLLNIPAGD